MPRTDSASRVIAAPLESAWAALVDPGALLAWLPPGGMTGRFERFDARPGATYRMVLSYSDASGAPGKASMGSPPSSTAALDKPSASRHPHRHWRRRCADPLRPPKFPDTV